MRHSLSLARTLAGLFLPGLGLMFLVLSEAAGISHQEKSGQSPDGGKVSLGARTIIPAPVWVIGSYDSAGRPNMMTSSWVGVCCSRPASVMTCLRPATYTHGNIMARKAFTVNIPSESLAAIAAAVGQVSGRDVDKFKKTGLTPVKSDLVDAPYIKEFPMVIECQLKQTIELGSHTMFIGEIKDIKADRSVLDKEGAPAIEKVKPFVYAPVSAAFYAIGRSLGSVADLAKEAERR